MENNTISKDIWISNIYRNQGIIKLATQIRERECVYMYGEEKKQTSPHSSRASQVVLVVKNPPANAGD